MNVLFITIGRMESMANHGIYTDLLRHFRDCGHRIFTVSAYEKRTGLDTALIDENGVKMLHVSIGNITKCNILEKGISTLQIETKFLSAIRKYFGNEKFDLVLLDPPYAADLLENAIAHLARFDILAPHGIIVAEHPVEKAMPALAVPYRLHRTYRYGKISLTVYRRDGNQNTEE